MKSTRRGPYEIPAAIQLKSLQKERIRSRSLTRIEGTNETPLRRRTQSNSENCSTTDRSKWDFINKSFSCLHLRQPGLHLFGPNNDLKIHLEHDFLNRTDTRMFCKQLVIDAIQDTIQAIPDTLIERNTENEHIKPVIRSWEKTEVDNVTYCNLLEDHLIDLRNDDILLHLLGRINRLAMRTKSTVVPFDTIEIVSLLNRNFKFQLNPCYYKQEDEDPLLILYIGKGRSINMIPKTFSSSHQEVIDLELEDFSALTVFPMASKNMNITLAKEKDVSRTNYDLHTLIIPRRSCRVNTTAAPKSSTCLKNEETAALEMCLPEEEPRSLAEVSVANNDKKAPSPENYTHEPVVVSEVFCGSEPCLQESDSFNEDEKVTMPKSCSVTCHVEKNVSPELFSPKSLSYRDKEKVASPAPILQESDTPNRDEKASTPELYSQKLVTYPLEKNAASPEQFSPESVVYCDKGNDASPETVIQESEHYDGDEKADMPESCAHKPVTYRMEENITSTEPLLKGIDLILSSGVQKNTPAEPRPEESSICHMIEKATPTEPLSQEIEFSITDMKAVPPEPSLHEMDSCRLEKEVTSPEPHSPQSVIHLLAPDSFSGDEKDVNTESRQITALRSGTKRNVSPELCSPESQIPSEEEKVQNNCTTKIDSDSISKSTVAKIINSHNNNTLNSWLKICGLINNGRAIDKRNSLIKFNSMNCIPKSLIGKILNKMKDELVEEELQNLGLNLDGAATVRKNRLKEFLIKNTDKRECQAENIISPIATPDKSKTLEAPIKRNKTRSSDALPSMNKKHKKNKKRTSTGGNITTASVSKDDQDPHERRMSADKPGSSVNPNILNGKTENLPDNVTQKPSQVPHSSSICYDTPLKTLEASMLKINDEVFRQKNCIDLILDEQANKQKKVINPKFNEPNSNKDIERIKETIIAQQKAIELIASNLVQDKNNNTTPQKLQGNPSTELSSDSALLLQNLNTQLSTQSGNMDQIKKSLESIMNRMDNDSKQNKLNNSKLEKKNDAPKSVQNDQGQNSHGVIKEINTIHEKISNKSLYIHEVEKQGMTMSANLSKRLASLEIHGVPLGTTTTDHHEKVVTSPGNHTHEASVVQQKSSGTSNGLAEIDKSDKMIIKQLENTIEINKQHICVVEEQNQLMYNAIEKRIKSLETSGVISNKEPLNSQFNTVYMIKPDGNKLDEDENALRKQDTEKNSKVKTITIIKNKMPNQTNSRAQNIKCLLIHDRCHSEFKNTLFDGRYEITKYKADTIGECTNNKKLRHLLSTLKPDCIFLHVGLEDIARGQKVEEVVNLYVSLLKELTSTTLASICISEIIACVRYTILCKKTHAVNEYVHKLVTKMRQDDSTLTSRLCTFNNNKLIGHLHWKPGTDTKYEISERGKGMLWLRLKYGLQKLTNLSSQYVEKHTISSNKNA